MKIDVKDKRILAALDMDARMPFTELAKKVSLSRQVVEYRLKRLQKDSVILGTYPIIDCGVVGYSKYVVAFRLLNITVKEKEELVSLLLKHSYLHSLREVGGNWDLIVTFICKDNAQFDTVFDDIIAEHGDHIRDYDMLLVINQHEFEKVYFDGSERKEFFHTMKNLHTSIDELDQGIIAEFSQKLFPSSLQVGKTLKVTGNTVRNRIKDMVERKILLGFRLATNATLLGKQTHMLFLEMNHPNSEKEKEFHRYLQTLPAVLSVTKYIGKWRYGIQLETENHQQFQELFTTLRGRFSTMISDFQSFPVFRTQYVSYFPQEPKTI